MLTSDIKKYISQSVLCWLATSCVDNIPNVSPKEFFTFHGDDNIIIANIASPQTVKNILVNKNVCVSFIDILVQKGYQLKGTAEIIKKNNPTFDTIVKPLEIMAGDKFPIGSIISIKVTSIKPIFGSGYMIYPATTTEANQIKRATKIYKLD